MAEKALSLAKEPEEKSISQFLCISALLFKGESERGEQEIETLINHLKGFEKGFRVVEWDFSPLLPIIEETLEAKNKRKLLSVISLLKGEISLEDFLKKE